MTKQDKIYYKNPVAQNLLFLIQNEDFQKSINSLKKTLRHANQKAKEFNLAPRHGPSQDLCLWGLAWRMERF